MNRFCHVIITLLSLVALSSTAAIAGPQGTYLEISPADSEDLASLLDTLEKSIRDKLPMEEPVIIVLHGDEAFDFTRNSYASNKELVDRAALLDAYNLIDVRMCRTWMDENSVAPQDLPPFIETVPYAPEEIERLKAEGFIPYDSVRI